MVGGHQGSLSMGRGHHSQPNVQESRAAELRPPVLMNFSSILPAGPLSTGLLEAWLLSLSEQARARDREQKDHRHLWLCRLRTSTRHFACCYLRKISRGNSGSRGGPGVSTWRLSSGSHFGSFLPHLDESCRGGRTQRTRLCVSTPRKMASIKETPDTLQCSSEDSSLLKEWSLVFSVLFWDPSRIYSSWLYLFFLTSLICHSSCLPTPQGGKLPQ